MTTTNDRLRLIGGKLPVYMAETYIWREGELQQQFSELDGCIRPVQVLCQVVPDLPELESAVRKVRHGGLYSVQQVVRCTAEYIRRTCQLTTDELQALVTGLYVEWQNRRQRPARSLPPPELPSKKMRTMPCSACGSFGYVSEWVIDGEHMKESIVRELYGTDVMFDLAGQQNVQVQRVRCTVCV